jgi:hypothetical protein
MVIVEYSIEERKVNTIDLNELTSRSAHITACQTSKSSESSVDIEVIASN